MRAFLPFLLLMGACDKSVINVGDYAVFVVAYSEVEQSEECFPDGEPLDEVGDATTFRTGGTFAIFASADETFLLEMDGVVLQGSLSEDVYSFAATSTDIDFFGYEDENRTSVELDFDVEITVDKLTMSGESVSDVQTDCVGPDCGDPSSTSCTLSTNFSGSRVEDVDLKHEL